MDWQNRWRTIARPALAAVVAAALWTGASQAQTTVSASSPAADRTDSPPPNAFGRTEAGSHNQLTDFDRSTQVTDRRPPLIEDRRPQRDRDAFENPPAGHDPRYFRIEIAPLEDRRTRQFFETEPFAPLGWRIGGFIFFQEVELDATWDSNVFLGRDARGDRRLDFVSESRLVSDWSNHALELRMRHDRSYHRRFTQEDDAGEIYEVRGRLDITRRTNIEARGAHEITQESRDSVDASGTLGAPRADVVTNRADVTLNHRFNRLSLQLRGGFTDTDYEEATGTAVNPRDLERRTVAMRAQWEFRPTFSIFGEVERDRRRHPGVAASDGLSRNSDGERYRAGVALGQTGAYLRGEASIGYGVQRPDVAALPHIEAFLVDANVAWRVTELTSLLFTAETDIGETVLAGSSGVVERRIGLSARHAFSHRLRGEAGVSYGTQDYKGAALDERDVTFDANVEYSFNRHAALFSRYQHVRFRSSDATRDYDVDTVMVGARLRN